MKLRRPPSSRDASGATLTELMVIVAIIAIVSTVALPNLLRFIEVERLRNAVEFVHQKLLIARSEALKQSTTINFYLQPGTQGAWWIGISDNDTCNPSNVGACTITTMANGVTTTLPHSYDGTDFPDTSLSANFPTASGNVQRIRFEPIRTTSNNGTITVSSTAGSVQIRLSILGRVTVCAPTNAPVGGYPACP